MIQVTTPQLLSFIQLVKFDKKLRDLDSDQHIITTELAKITDQINDLSTLLKNQEDAVHNQQKRAHHLELEGQTIDKKLEEYSAKLHHSNNAKEYTSLMEEIEQLKKQRQQCDDQLLELWHIVEKEVAAFDLKKQQIEKEMDALKKEAKHLIARREQARKQLDNLQSNRELIVSDVLDELIDLYERKKDKISKPVLPVAGVYCGGCSFELSSADRQYLEQQYIVPCKECFRLLYLAELVHGENAG